MKKLSKNLKKEIQKLYSEGLRQVDIVKILGCTRQTVRYHTFTEEQAQKYFLNRKEYAKNNKEKYNKYASKWRQENRLKSVLNQIHIKCKRLNLPFNLDEKDFPGPYICPVLGTEIKFGDRSDFRHAASFDRIVPELGYTKNNVRIISLRANSCKGDLTLSELQALVHYVKSNTPNEQSS